MLNEIFTVFFGSHWIGMNYCNTVLYRPSYTQKSLPYKDDIEKPITHSLKTYGIGILRKFTIITDTLTSS